MKDMFDAVGMPNIRRSVFDIGHENVTSFKMGELVPYCAIDVLPGDVFRFNVQNLLRFAPLIAPVMSRVDVYTHFFFVPYRILWDGFEDFILDNEDAEEAPFVQLTNVDTYLPLSPADYMGFPAGESVESGSVRASPFPMAAYRLIYDHYYRDQNLVPEVYVPLVSGDNTTEYGPANPLEQACRICAMEHDYFTSALPQAQKGDPVTLPLTFAQGIPVYLDTTDERPQILRYLDGALATAPLPVTNDLGPSPYFSSMHVGDDPAVLDPNETLFVDIQSQAVTLDTLRTAIAIQEFLERDMRSGTRYREKIRGQYGVVTSDARVQVPEYIGGVRQVMAISEVLSTAQSDNDPGEASNVVGQMAGHGISVGGGYFSYRAEEWGIIIGVISVRPQTMYQQGLHRMWQKFDAIEHFAWPAFANLGEQIITQKEIFLNTGTPDAEWGYQSRYAEYKSIPSRVSGEMRTSLSFWHLGQIFATAPALEQSFIEATPAKFDRVFAVSSELASNIYARLIVQGTAMRPLPRFGIPTFGTTSTR